MGGGLKSVNQNPQKYRISLKKHKENNSGKPVIKSINYHTSEISCSTDHHLQPLVREITSYIKDTNDFMNKINNLPFSLNSVFVTIDVKSLNTQVILITKGLLQ